MIAVLHEHRDVADTARGLVKAEFERPRRRGRTTRPSSTTS